MGSATRWRCGVALALSMCLTLCQGLPLLAASTQQLREAIDRSGLVGSRFELQRNASRLTILSEQIFPNTDELKLALLQMASLLESSEPGLQKVTLRAYLLNKPNPYEGSIAPAVASRLQRDGDPEMLAKIDLTSVRGPAKRSPLIAASEPIANRSDDENIPVLGDPIDAPPARTPPAPRPARSAPPKGRSASLGDLAVIGDPIYPGQKVADPARGDTSGASTPALADANNGSRPFNTRVSVLRAGSPIPVLLDREVIVSGDQPVAFQAVVLQDILSDEGDLVVPGGSRVRGTVEPTPSGARLTLRELTINNRQYAIRAVSPVYPSQVSRSGGDMGTGMAIGGVVGGVGGSIIGGSVDRRWGGLWGGLLGGLLGSFLGGSLSRPQVRTTVVIPQGTINPQLVDDLTIGNY